MNKFKPGNFYMHKNCSDACVLVVTPFAFETVHVIWYNLGYTGNPWSLNEFSIVKFNNNWIDITSRMHIKRNKSGLP